MTTVKQLIDYLSTLDPDASVMVLKEEMGVYEAWATWVQLDLDPIRGNVNYSEHYKYLEIGDK